VFILPASLSALGHGTYVGQEQERGCIGSRAQSLPLPYRGEIGEVLACPVHIHAT
jgi:hypothetical protein